MEEKERQLTAKSCTPEYKLSVNMAQRSIDNGLEQLIELMGMEIGKPFAITSDFDFAVQNYNLPEEIAFARENPEAYLNNRLERKKYEWRVDRRITKEKTH